MKAMHPEWKARVKAARLIRVRAFAIGVAGFMLLMAVDRVGGFTGVIAGLAGCPMLLYGFWISMTHSEVSMDIRS